ncbi:MAG: hypothetical protein AABX03_00965 [Nanoarchaeota archaeon]
MIKNKRVSPLFKVFNKKRVPVCDYEGICKNKAYKEVYPFLLKKKHKKGGWSYLCKKHFLQEQKRYKRKLPYANVEY